MKEASKVETVNSSKPARLGIGIISAGKVGAVLGAALREAGHAIVGVHAVSEASQTRAEALLPGVPVLSIPEIVERSEVVLLAVPDDALPALVNGLAETTPGRLGRLLFTPADATARTSWIQRAKKVRLGWQFTRQ